MTIVEYGSRGAIRLRDLIYLRNAIALFLARGDGVEIFALSLSLVCALLGCLRSFCCSLLRHHHWPSAALTGGASRELIFSAI